VTNDWVEGPASKDYRGYSESMAKLKGASLESQIDNGGAWIGTPDEINNIIARVSERLGPFEHASLQVNFGMLPFAEAQKSMRLFASAIMPKFKTPDRSGDRKVAVALY
jgi:hypothetical protein